MKFEPKISGVMVTDFNIEPLQNALTLYELRNLSLRSIKYVIDSYIMFESATNNNDVVTILSVDDTYKIAIMESYPKYETELKLYFGENWLDHYIRFNH